jgi:hypothetical protein
LVEEVVSNESQESTSSEGLVTPSSGAWPYEAMERGLARPAIRKKTVGKQKSRIDRSKNSGI